MDALLNSGRIHGLLPFTEQDVVVANVKAGHDRITEAP
jgi:hypothetical protein